SVRPFVETLVRMTLATGDFFPIEVAGLPESVSESTPPPGFRSRGESKGAPNLARSIAADGGSMLWYSGRWYLFFDMGTVWTLRIDDRVPGAPTVSVAQCLIRDPLPPCEFGPPIPLSLRSRGRSAAFCLDVGEDVYCVLLDFLIDPSGDPAKGQC